MDGTLCDESHNGDYANAIPYQHAIDRVNELYRERDEFGHRLWKIVIQTARYMKRQHGQQEKAHQAGYVELQDWLVGNGVKFDQLYFGKASGAIYVDNRGCRVESSKGTTDWENVFAPMINQLRAERAQL